VAQVEATLRKRILRAFATRDLLQSFEAKDMLGYGVLAPNAAGRCASSLSSRTALTSGKYWSTSALN
jgi:hypothetical protein